LFRETHRAAALRELREEVGHAPAELGQCVWVREHEFEYRGTRYRQRERFFLARTEPFTADMRQMDEYELEVRLGSVVYNDLWRYVACLRSESWWAVVSVTRTKAS
jgi:8-oxo-dGTP pyrophosphatase MutT (NUDIX family)